MPKYPLNRITDKQKRILNYIEQYYTENSVPPTVRAICQGLGYKSPATVQVHLQRLREFGYLEHDMKPIGKSISTGAGAPSVVPKVPILGNVAAGSPILANQEVLGYVSYPTTSVSDYFALYIRGDSMVGAGILDGDIVVAKRNCDFLNGDIVIALIEDEATCKEFFKDENGQVLLRPKNPQYSDIDGNHCDILGVVKTVIRNY